MKKLSIKKNNEVVQHCNFESDEAMQAFIQLLADQAPWGKPERWVKDTPMSPLSDEDKAKALETRTVDVMGEQVKEYKLGAEYEIDIKDITAEVKAEKQAKEAKKLAKEKRKDDRKKLDWSKINSIAELKAIVKSLVEEIED